MAPRRRLIVALVVALAASAPWAALADSEGAPPAPPPTIAFKPIVDAVVDKVILPGYESLAATSADEAVGVGALCATPGAASLAGARDGFARLVGAWSRVEMFRFGPARQDNRFERIFFWPDQKGLGQRQVEEILRSEDASATEPPSLRQKSVAVQGLLALEVVLFGDGSDGLAGAPPQSFRCRYGHAVAGAIATTAREILDGWKGPGGYAALMRSAGPDNPAYRTHGEVVQDLFRAERELLQIDHDLKLARPIGESSKAATPRRAPFWRSDQTLAAIGANIEAAIDLQRLGGFAEALPEALQWYPKSLAFELRQAEESLRAVDAGEGSWEAAARDPASHKRLAYALIQLRSAIELLTTDYPQALGLTTGFNASDGD